MDTILLGIGLGFIVMVLLIIILILKDNKSNIDYIICQTFTGNQKWYKAIGLVDVKNDGSYTVVHKVMQPKLGEIGSFHQKHLKPGKGNRYFMLLNEWDKGRFAPMEYTGKIKDLVFQVPKKDETGKLMLDAEGNVIMEVKKTQAGELETISNSDVDFIIQQRKKNEVITKRQEKNKAWWPVVAGGAGFVLLLVVMVYMVMQNTETAKINADASASIAAQQERTAEIITKTIIDLVRNETIHEAFKKPQLPPNPPTG
jgi:hypothetical protein